MKLKNTDGEVIGNANWALYVGGFDPAQPTNRVLNRDAEEWIELGEYNGQKCHVYFEFSEEERALADQANGAESLPFDEAHVTYIELVGE